jgi:hypothetical protein
MEPEIRQFIPEAARLSSRAAFVRHRRRKRRRHASFQTPTVGQWLSPALIAGRSFEPKQCPLSRGEADMPRPAVISTSPLRPCVEALFSNTTPARAEKAKGAPLLDLVLSLCLMAAIAALAFLACAAL